MGTAVELSSKVAQINSKLEPDQSRKVGQISLVAQGIAIDALHPKLRQKFSNAGFA